MCVSVVGWILDNDDDVDDDMDDNDDDDDDGGGGSQVMGQCGGLDIGRATRHRSLPLRVADAEENNWLSRKPDI